MPYLNKIRALLAASELQDEMLEEYQRTAVQFLKDTPRSALFIDTGLGKTAICLRLIRDLVDADELKKVLIIAPLKVANQTWGNEIENWRFSCVIPHKLIRNAALAENINAAGRTARTAALTERDLKKIERKVTLRMKKVVRDNPNADERQLAKIREGLVKTTHADYLKHLGTVARHQASAALVREMERTNPTIISVINHEQVEWLVEAWGNDWPYDCVIYDESDAIKDASTKRWKALNSIKHLTTRFYELTATPAAEDYLGLFAQIKLLDGGKRLGRTMTEYKSRFFDVNPYNYSIKLKEGADEQITAAIADITLVMKQEDYLKDIPPYVIENVSYQLPEKAAELYQKMSRSGTIITPCGAEIYAEQAVSVIQKMMQIAAGFVYDSQETVTDFGGFSKTRKIYHLHDAKIDALKGLLARFPDDNILVSYYHQGSLEKLVKHFPQAVKMDRKGTQTAAWNEGKIKMLLMHPKSGAHGLNLQKGGHIVINYDVYFSYAQFYQFLRRLARRGQSADKVLVFNLLAAGTYDVFVERSCWQDKKNRQNAFFDMIKTLKFKAKK